MDTGESLFYAFLGLSAGICIFIKSILEKTTFSPIPFYIVFGLLFRIFMDLLGTSTEMFSNTIKIFGDIGLILILFQVGVESNLQNLLKQIRKAVFISIFEVAFSGMTMFVAFYYLINLSLQNSLLLSVAFAATSIVISVASWKEAGVLKSKPGELVLDLSAMDDIASITLMVILFALASKLTGDVSNIFSIELLPIIFSAIFKLLIFIVLAYIFSVHIEPTLSKFIKKYEIGPDPIVTLICLALIFSGFVGFFGLSIALGSFLIGLAFSRDASAVRMLGPYRTLESLFIPLFFFSIGFSVSEIYSISIATILILFLAAVVGKVIGVGVPSYLFKYPFSTSLILGCSMVPRAEVSLAVIGYSKHFFHIPEVMYSQSVIVVLLTCFSHIVLKPLLLREFKNYVPE